MSRPMTGHANPTPALSEAEPAASGRPVLRYGGTAAIAFAALAATVLISGARAFPADLDVHRFLLAHRTAPVVTALRAVTATGTGGWPYLLAAAGGLLAAPAVRLPVPRGRAVRTLLLCLAFTGWLALGQAVRFALMTAIARPRPPGEDWITHASRWSFPSGHATTSAMAAGLLVTALAVRRPPAWRLWAILPLCWAVLVGVSRLWLGVHWASDVVGGWLLATTWILLGVAIAAASGLLTTRTRGRGDEQGES
ncbi:MULTISPECIES: phosphatase PAP2 family protein [unclassified Streptomyces]|uniref:phosphatase PAP2 family protein n=1 Tax=unclassified Streptomyces TaxID=2593676 RepID=UPI0038078537